MNTIKLTNFDSLQSLKKEVHIKEQKNKEMFKTLINKYIHQLYKGVLHLIDYNEFYFKNKSIHVSEYSILFTAELRHNYVADVKGKIELLYKLDEPNNIGIIYLHEEKPLNLNTIQLKPLMAIVDVIYNKHIKE